MSFEAKWEEKKKWIVRIISVIFSDRIIFRYRNFVLFFFSFNIFERITDIFGLVDENVGHIGGEHGAWRVMYINWELILKTERFVFIREINSLFGFWKVDSWKIYLLLLSCNSFLSSYRYIYIYIYRKVSFYFYFISTSR